MYDTIREERYRVGKIENRKERWKVPAWRWSPDENGLRAENETASAGTPTAKEVSHKDHLIAAKEKTTWNARRELGDERWGDEDNGANSQHLPAKIMAIKKKSKNNRRKAQPHPVDCEQLQDDEEQPRAQHIRGKRGDSDETRSEMRAQSSAGRATVNDPGYTARTDEGGETKTPNSSEICELHKTRRARAGSADGTPAQRVERVKEGWGDVRASTGKRGTPTHNLRVRPAKRHPSHAGKCPLRRTSPSETCKSEPTPKIPESTIEKTNKEKTGKDRHSPTKQLPTSTAVCDPGRREQRSRRERTGGAVVLQDRPCVVVLVVLRLGFRRMFVRSVAIETRS
ncbi:hypothetical protein B0H14DRAFT_2559649 [Mycena olivaceomarginata]|nr:hypothetical protein B0H14DRAFT_2559649 [Mycena olivaceomarginata]